MQVEFVNRHMGGFSTFPLHPRLDGGAGQCDSGKLSSVCIQANLTSSSSNLEPQDLLFAFSPTLLSAADAHSFIFVWSWQDGDGAAVKSSVLSVALPFFNCMSAGSGLYLFPLFSPFLLDHLTVGQVSLLPPFVCCSCCFDLCSALSIIMWLGVGTGNLAQRLQFRLDFTMRQLLD